MSASSTTYTFTKRLGRGSFGTVWEAKTGSGEVVAIKVVPLDEEGIPSLLEMSIMMSYSHPYINKALHVETSGRNLCIVQEKADADLEAVICTKRGDGMVSPSPLPLDLWEKWVGQLLQAIYQMHQEGLIHADIKPQNCLIFGTTIKVTDFSLTLKKIRTEDTFSQSIATIHYRAPEVLQGASWNEAIDVWALGCTFYVMATGELLVPHQGKLLTSELDEQAQRLQLRGKNLSAIVHWRHSLGDKAASRYLEQTRGGTALDINFFPVKLAPHWERIPTHYRQLILRMTSFDPKARPSIESCLRACGYNSGLATLTLLGTSGSRIDSRTQISFERVAAYCFADIGDPAPSKELQKAIVDLSLSLYKRTNTMLLPGVYASKPLVRIECCLWMGLKLLTGLPFNTTRSALPDILQMEMTICKFLDYRLHTILPDSDSLFS